MTPREKASLEHEQAVGHVPSIISIACGYAFLPVKLGYIGFCKRHVMRGSFLLDDLVGHGQCFRRLYLKKPDAVLSVTARTAREVTVLDSTTGRVLPVSRPCEP